MNKKRITTIIKSSALLSALCLTSIVAEASDWGYEPGEVLPADWGTIHGFETCGDGKKQSPIDLSQSSLTAKKERVRVGNLPDLVFDYHSSPLEVINNGHTVEFEYEPGSIVRLRPGGPEV